MSTITFTGNLGRDVEVRQAGSSTVATFPVAVKTGYGERERTTWYRCQLWGKRAEGGLIPYLTKGAQVFITGEHSGNEFQKKDNTTGYSNDVNIDRVNLVGGKPQGQQNSQQGYQRPQPAQQPAQQQPAADFDDDIPF